MLLVPLSEYLLSSVKNSVDMTQYINSGSSDQCSEYMSLRSWFDWFEELNEIITGLIINIFMLRNMKVAAVLRADSIEEETSMRNKINKFTNFFLPGYFVLQIGIYVLQLLIFSSIDKQKSTGWLLAFYLIFDLIKLILSSFLGVTTYLFAQKIMKLIKLFAYEFGE